MIRKTYTDRQIVQSLIDLAIKRQANDFRTLLRGLNSGPSGGSSAGYGSVSRGSAHPTLRRSFVASTGAFGEFQQGTSVGFSQHYTRRS